MKWTINKKTSLSWNLIKRFGAEDSTSLYTFCGYYRTVLLYILIEFLFYLIPSLGLLGIFLDITIQSGGILMHAYANMPRMELLGCLVMCFCETIIVSGIVVLVFFYIIDKIMKFLQKLRRKNKVKNIKPKICPVIEFIDKKD